MHLLQRFLDDVRNYAKLLHGVWSARVNVVATMHLLQRFLDDVRNYAKLLPSAPDAMEKFGVIANVIEEALKKVHAAMLKNEDGASLVLKQLESYLRELTICSNAERSLVLLQALDQTMSLADQKKSNRPDEGVRLCDICVDELK